MRSSQWNDENCFKELVFTSKNGRPNGDAIYNNAIKSILRCINRDRTENAKLEGKEPVLMESFSMHTLRHSYATRCFESGMKPKIVQEILGHSTLGVTSDIYMHTTSSHLHEEMKKFKNVNAS